MSSVLYFALIGLSMIWGFSFLFIKVLLSYFSPFAIVFFRSFVGVLVILSVMIIKKKKILLPKKLWFLIIVVGLTNSTLPWILISYSETLISSSVASILNATTPIWTVIVGILFFKSRIKPLQWVGIITGFIGIIVLMDINLGKLFVGNIYGYIGMILSSLFYGIGAQTVRNYFHNITTFQITLYTLLISSLCSGFFLLISGDINWLYFTEYQVIISVIGLGAFGSGIAFLIYNFMIKKASAEFASLVTYLVPISAMFWGMTLLGEEIKINMIIGLILILLGVFISSRK